MTTYKTFDNGLRLVLHKTEGLLSVTTGVLVKTGSINETESENGISHFIEHTMFKGTKKRSAFEISDFIDRIGAQINAFTSKEMTCYYTKSTYEHLEDSLEVLSDIFFNSVFDEQELEKEKGVVIEEISMSEDTPEDLCLDLLAKSYYGDKGLGQTILGPSKNIKSFNRKDIFNYLDKYYCADNVVISISGNFEMDLAFSLVEKYFADKFKRIKSAPQVNVDVFKKSNLKKSKKIEQTHLALAMPGINYAHPDMDAMGIANIVLGGGMSSRLFQKIREDLGLCYSIYSYSSQYKYSGVMEIYAGVNTEAREKAVKAIIDEVTKFKKDKINEQEFLRGREQIKSSLILGRESTASQMILYGKYLLFTDTLFDFNKKIESINNLTLDYVCEVIDKYFDTSNISSAAVGPSAKPLKI